MSLINVLLKMLLFAALNDSWLYWVHKFYHAETKWKFQQYLKKCHLVHHKKYALILHPVEWCIAIILPFGFCIYLFGVLLSTIFLAWGLFEASRGHGHFLKVPWLPRRFYKVCGYAEVRYHIWHHRHHKENLGQFLWYNDFLFGTMAKRWRRAL